MLLLTALLLGAVWLGYMSWKFYRRMDWEAPAEYTPDIAHLRKRQAELMHVQDVLQGAVDEGKLAPAAFAEVSRFLDKEIADLDAQMAPSPK